ncbi:MAG: TIGR00282 family metallophosphoesterase [bacterium]|nr:TIGR00282 family metallophosphoesterase [bacterium]
MKATARILFVGDIVGEPGLQALDRELPGLLHDTGADLCVANVENAWEGKSINAEILKRVRAAGVQVMTGGNHSWDRFQIHGLLKSEPGLLRPLNYPPGLAGRGWTTHMAPGLPPLVVMNVQGRVFMAPIDCPFRRLDEELQAVEREVAARARPPLILVDMHAEASAEKAALALHVDGRVAAVTGTHTHVQSSDERILPKGTAFITDAGMTGCHEGVIGMKSEVALRRFLLQTPQKYESALGASVLEGVLFTLDTASGRAVAVERIRRPDFIRQAG